MTERIYRLVLRLCLPAGLRNEAERELLEVFRDGRRSARRAGRLAALVFLLRALVDAVATGVAERRDRIGRPDRRRGGMGLDLRAGVRDITRSPGISALSVGTLGLGIAAAVLIGVLVRDVLLQPLPFAEPDRLVRLTEVSEDGGEYWPSLPNVIDWREQAVELNGVVAASVGTIKPVLLEGEARRAVLGEVTQGFFRLLGTGPVAGRLFSAEENSPGGPPVALIGEEFWNSLGRQDLEALALQIDRERYAVIGVIPAGFRFLGHGYGWLEADVWIPLERGPIGARTSHGYHTVARLGDGLTADDVRPGLERLATNLKAVYGEDTNADGIRVEPLAEAVVGEARKPLTLLAAAAGLVLLISCFNLGAGLLARGIAKEPLLAIRTALGARRGDLVRLQLVHASLLAIPGAALGGLIAWGALRVIRGLAGGAIPRLDQASLDAWALGGAVALALTVALGAGLLPALLLARSSSARLSTRSATRGKSRNLLWDLFVAGQLALTMALLVTSALLVRGMLARLDVDLGYQPDGVLLAEIALPEARYPEPDRRIAFYQNVLERLRATPGVSAAGIVSTPPDEVFAYISHMRRNGHEEWSWGGFRLADPGYFETLGIPVQQGSLSPTVDDVLVDRFLVDALWKDETPIGELMGVSFTDGSLRVAGVAGGIREWQQTAGGIGAVYLDYRRRPASTLDMYIVARGPVRGTVAAAIRGAVQETDPLVPIAIEPLRDRIKATMADRRLMLAIAIGFAATALTLAAAGVHSLITQAASLRSRETGIRLILGERHSSLRRRLLGMGLRAAFIGVVLGSFSSWGAARAVRSQLFGVSPLDPAGILAAATVLVGVAGLAAWLPARKATRTDPARLLHDA